MSFLQDLCDYYTFESIGKWPVIAILYFLVSFKEFSIVVCTPACTLECEAAQFMLGVLFVCLIKHLHFGSQPSVSMLSGACG